MKTAFTLTFLFLITLATAQSKTDLPRAEFVILLSENSLAIKPGESKQVTVSVIRSKSYANDKATLGFSNTLPQGVSLQYEHPEGNFESSIVTITAEPTALLGTYQMVLNATINHKTKGSILKLAVGNDPVAVK